MQRSQVCRLPNFEQLVSVAADTRITDSLNITREDMVLNNSSPTDNPLFQSPGFAETLEAGDFVAPFINNNGITSNAGLALVVNETLRLAKEFPPPPPMKVPFSRLAWYPFEGSSSIYIYHQINESALAEEALLESAGWKTTIIPVSTG